MQIVKNLLAASAKINQPLNSIKRTPLLQAVSHPNCSEEMVRLLLKSGANPNAKDQFGHNALVIY
ncbi:MAG: ankyrin repeat domain-containing protein [Deltaproteobacteria bacterium]|nr:ankyrin repeat domain-containing protein [Deltaproteobacteria bacterium]